VSRGALVRRAVPAVAATAAVVALLANVRARPPAISAPADAGQPPPPPAATVEPEVRRVSGRRPTKKGPVRSATDTSTTPFSIISVRVTLTGADPARGGAQGRQRRHRRRHRRDVHEPQLPQVPAGGHRQGPGAWLSTASST
jgi:hypothetical protein